MKRRDFMKAVAATPLAGKDTRREAIVIPCRIEDQGRICRVHMSNEAVKAVGHACQTMWCPEHDGVAGQIIIHKDGLDVRFVE